MCCCWYLTIFRVQKVKHWHSLKFGIGQWIHELNIVLVHLFVFLDILVIHSFTHSKDDFYSSFSSVRCVISCINTIWFSKWTHFQFWLVIWCGSFVLISNPLVIQYAANCKLVSFLQQKHCMWFGGIFLNYYYNLKHCGSGFNV